MNSEIANSIEGRVILLQRALLKAKSSLRDQELTFEDQHDDFCLKVIEILDYIDRLSPKDGAIPQDSLAKIKRLIVILLKRKNVEELKSDKVELGTVKVVGTRVMEDRLDGTILEVVRKGYRRQSRTLRPLEVISVLNEG